jgi:hypothetical protein
MRLDSIIIPDGNGGFLPCPALMTEDELIRLLRIPEISKGNYGYVIENLKRVRDLPCIHISKRCLYPLEAVLEWVSDQHKTGRRR